jgi:hypothetical protein
MVGRLRSSYLNEILWTRLYRFQRSQRGGKNPFLLEIVMEEFVRNEGRAEMAYVKGSIRSFKQKVVQYNICCSAGEAADI